MVSRNDAKTYAYGIQDGEWSSWNTRGPCENGKINFYKEIIPNLDKSNYEQLMTVKSKGQDFVVYCKQEKNAITEFVLVSGGEDNVLIYVEGSLSLSEAKRISNDLAQTHKLRELENSSN